MDGNVCMAFSAECLLSVKYEITWSLLFQTTHKDSFLYLDIINCDWF